MVKKKELFRVKKYPEEAKTVTGMGVGYLELPDTELWIELLKNGRCALCLGDFRNFKKSKFKRNHAQMVLNFDPTDMGRHSYVNYKYSVRYELKSAGLGSDIFFKVDINLKRHTVDNIQFEGLLFHPIDYKFFLGLRDKLNMEPKK